MSAFIIYTPFVFIGFGFALVALFQIRRVLRIVHLVKSNDTHRLQDIPSYLNKHIELHSEVNGEFIISPISKTKCVKYKVEVYYSFDNTELLSAGGMGLMKSATSEEKEVESVYIVEGSSVISINLDDQKKVYMNTFDWHLLNIKQKHVVENYLNSEHNKYFIESLGDARNYIFGVKESIIPHGEKIYLLGKVIRNPRIEGEYIETKKNYKFFPYTIKGYMDSVSENHFLIHLRKRIMFYIYTAIAFSTVPLIIILSCFNT